MNWATFQAEIEASTNARLLNKLIKLLATAQTNRDHRAMAQAIIDRLGVRLNDAGLLDDAGGSLLGTRPAK